MVILDTNVLSALMRTAPDLAVLSWLDRQPRPSLWTTAVTVLEIRYGLGSMPAGRKRTLRLKAFGRLVDEMLERRILPFDHDAAEVAASLMSDRHSIGRPRDLRDSMIAGIALARRATLATRNARHFDDLTVAVIDPWHG